MNREADRADWEKRYADRDKQAWSGEPNGTLVEEAGKLAPGRAFEIGCGEGADAIWLAQQGWDVTAIDISETAITRATSAAIKVGVSVNFRTVDILVDPPDARSYDLVAMSYPALKKITASPALKAIIEAVASGGRLLVVMHAQSEQATAFAISHGFNPSDYLSGTDIIVGLGLDFDVVIDAERERPNAPADTVHQRDHVVLAQRH